LGGGRPASPVLKTTPSRPGLRPVAFGIPAGRPMTRLPGRTRATLYRVAFFRLAAAGRCKVRCFYREPLYQLRGKPVSLQNNGPGAFKMRPGIRIISANGP